MFSIYIIISSINIIRKFRYFILLSILSFNMSILLLQICYSIMNLIIYYKIIFL